MLEQLCLRTTCCMWCFAIVKMVRFVFNVYCYKMVFVNRDARNMARDVPSALTTILQTQGNMDECQAASYIKELQSENQFLQDVWS